MLNNKNDENKVVSLKKKRVKNKSLDGSKKIISQDVKKLKLLVTIINCSRAILYLDTIEQFDVNFQMVIYGKGTATSSMLDMLGLGQTETDKAVIFSVINEAKTKDVLETLKEKFEKVKNGNGIAYTIPLNSVIGVSIYQFLSNNRIGK